MLILPIKVYGPSRTQDTLKLQIDKWKNPHPVTVIILIQASAERPNSAGAANLDNQQRLADESRAIRAPLQ